VLVSFGEMNGALRCKVWCTDSLVYYAEQLNFKRQLPKAYEDVEDDPHQMGGNIVLQVEDSVYKAVYIHRSKSPPDRPTPNELIDFIQKCLI